MSHARSMVRWFAGLTLLAPAWVAAQAQARPAETRLALVTSGAGVALQPGDVLRLRIWREPDLSGDYPVDEKGTVILPRLGATVVTGVPTDQLKERLVERYREYLNNPSIEITALRRIAVLGAVRNPGMFPVEPTVTLGGVAILAGGPTEKARPNLVELRRGHERRRIDLRKNPELATLPLESGDQVYLPEKSWFSQNAPWFVSTLVGAAGTVAFLVTR